MLVGNKQKGCEWCSSAGGGDSGQLLWKEMKIQGSGLAFRMKMKNESFSTLALFFCSSCGLTIHSWKTFASKSNVNYHNEKQTDIWQSKWQCLLNFNEEHIWWKHCKSLKKKNRLFHYPTISRSMSMSLAWSKHISQRYNVSGIARRQCFQKCKKMDRFREWVSYIATAPSDISFKYHWLWLCWWLWLWLCWWYSIWLLKYRWLWLCWWYNKWLKQWQRTLVFSLRARQLSLPATERRGLRNGST